VRSSGLGLFSALRTAFTSQWSVSPCLENSDHEASLFAWIFSFSGRVSETFWLCTGLSRTSSRGHVQKK
jgi:hypothetical protein